MDSSPPEAAQLPATQKPQGGFPFLTAFDDSIIPQILVTNNDQFAHGLAMAAVDMP